MKREGYEQHDGLGLAALIRRREVTPSEALDAALSAVDAANPALDAVGSRFDDRARAAIAASVPEAPFTGVPYLLKDLGVLYAGTVTGFGTSLVNPAGDPAMSVPLAWSRPGLPHGVQFAARFGGEATLFRLAGQLEQEQGWAARRPPR